MKCLVTLITVLGCIQLGTSIRCYECNSGNNSMCADPEKYDEETLRRYLRHAECGAGLASHHSEQFFCRKMVQTILHKHHDSEVRVMRGCGWMPSHRACYTADNEDHLETVCQCYTDMCNAGRRTLASLVWLAVAASAVTVLSHLIN